MIVNYELYLIFKQNQYSDFSEMVIYNINNIIKKRLLIISIIYIYIYIYIYI